MLVKNQTKWNLPELAQDWEYKQLGDMLLTVVDNRGKTPPLTDHGIKLIETKHLSNNALYPLEVSENNQKYVSQQTFDTWFRGHPQENDILFSTVGSNFPQRCLVPPNPYFCTGQNLVALRPNPKIIDPWYLLLALGHRTFLYQVDANTITTAQPSIRVKDLLECVIIYPPLHIQKHIASLYKAILNKIELNRRLNATLEEMARAIFKSWFVDFDPVHAKANGTAYPLDAATMALFPDRFEEVEGRMVPEGWRVFKLEQVLELNYGKSLRKKDRVAGHVPVYGSNGQIDWHNEHLVKGPGIVVGRKGSAGIVTWVHEDFYPIDTTFYVSSKKISSLSFLYYSLEKLDLPSLVSDSAVPGLNRNMAYMSPILIPSTSILDAFQNLIRTFNQRVDYNNHQSQTIADLRDTLLPKLISGQLRVTEAAEMVEEVT
ncbi:MAG TPA: restriction endonuclease subunit S [Anaerolineae bacterium]|nr:restriction endonuclease subunit S [Anaerolineae bacterium]